MWPFRPWGRRRDKQARWRKASSEFEELSEERPRSLNFLVGTLCTVVGQLLDPKGKECRRYLDLA